jgi:hypothetical protein
MRYAAPISSLVLLLAVAGCQRRITNANIDAVNSAWERKGDKGVAPKEVESILGQPDRVEPFKIPLETEHRTIEGLRYYYAQDGEEVVAHFLDNKLTAPMTRLHEAAEPNPEEKAAEEKK